MTEKTMNTQLARWLGLLVTDGSINKNKRFLKFTNRKSILLINFRQLTRAVFGIEGKIIHSKNRVPEVQVNSVSLIKEINEKFDIPIGNKKGKLKVPRQIMSCNNKEVICKFLQGVFDGDGSVFQSKKHHVRQVTLTNKNEVFLEQIKTLLERLGMKPFIVRSQNRVVIASIDDIIRFKNKIGFVHTDRQRNY